MPLFVKPFCGMLVQHVSRTMNKADTRRLIKKLKNASVCCFDCGNKYGVPSVSDSTMWVGVCAICEQQTVVTEARDFAYFITGIKKLTESIITSQEAQ